MPIRTTPWPNGTPCWVDLGAPDVAAARALYAQVLGWTFVDLGPDSGGYVLCQRNGHDAAAIGPQQSPDDPQRWTTYFAADDVDATAAKIREAGGRVLLEPGDVGPMGRLAIAADPQGSVFGLWQAGAHLGARIYGEPGGLVWNEAAVADPHAAQQFYGAVFGFTFSAVEEIAGYWTFATGGDPLGGLGGLDGRGARLDGLFRSRRHRRRGRNS